MPRLPDVPARIGPFEFGALGRMVAVRCPHDFDPLMRRAGGQWEPYPAPPSEKRCTSALHPINDGAAISVERT